MSLICYNNGMITYTKGCCTLFSKKRLIILAVLLVLGIIAAGYFLSRPAQSVKVLSIKKQDLIDSIGASGKLAFENNVTVRSELSGIVKELKLKPGDTVATGGVLAILDDGELQRAVQKAQNDLLSANNKLNGLKTTELKTAEEEIVQLEENKKYSQYNLSSEKRIYESQTLIKDARERLNQARLSYDKKQEEYSRISELLLAGSITKQEQDNKKYELDIAKSQYDAAVISLDALVPDRSLQNAQLSLEQIESRLRQAKNKRDAILPGGTDYQAALISIKDSELALETARQNAAKAYIYAPFDAIIMDRFAVAGERINANDKLLSIAKREALYIKAAVDEKYLPELKINQSVLVFPQGFNTQIKAQITKILPAIDSQRGIVDFEVRLNELPDYLKSDMTVNIDIVKESYKGIIYIPKKYLNKDLKSITAVSQGIVKNVQIKITKEINDKVIIEQGLSEGDFIIEPGSAKEGTKVSIIK